MAVRAARSIGRHAPLGVIVESGVSAVDRKRVPRKTLLIPSAIGFFAMLAVTIKGQALPQAALWLLVTCFVLAVATELVAIPLALWRMLLTRSLRTRANALCVAVAAVFLLSVVLEIAV